MKQKLSLCCSLIHDPDLLILDEPTTGVDPLSRRQFWELVDRIRADRPGMTVEQIRNEFENGQIDPLKDFSTACRAELLSIAQEY